MTVRTFLAGPVVALVLMAAGGPTRPAVNCAELQAQALANEAQRLTRLLEQGAEVECRDPVAGNSAALMQAANAGSVDAV